MVDVPIYWLLKVIVTSWWPRLSLRVYGAPCLTDDAFILVHGKSQVAELSNIRSENRMI